MPNNSLICLILVIVLSFGCKTHQNNTAPDPTRFAEEIAKFEKIKTNPQQPTIVFTGSSSIRFWPNISSYYPAQQVVNTGFGGSQMSDLLHYLDEAVLRFAPAKVFIYEGDNDVAAGQSTAVIMKNTKQVVKSIQKKFPEVEIILIAAKPSIARWNFKDKYLDINATFQAYAAQNDQVQYADVWTVMLDEQGEVRTDIFIEDGLHMNELGYQLWDGVLRDFVVK